MPTATQCPKCGHPDTAVYSDGNIHCPNCQYDSRTGASSSQTDARRLAEELRDQADMDAIVRDWPAPISHELTALNQLLHDGDTAAAFYQLRDLSEVLIKLPAVILARDLIEYSKRSNASVEITIDKQTLPVVEHIRRSLFGRSPSAGHWLGLLRELAGLGPSKRLKAYLRLELRRVDLPLFHCAHRSRSS